MGDVLLQEVYSHVGLEEMDYFGLQFFDKHDQMVGGPDTRRTNANAVYEYLMYFSITGNRLWWNVKFLICA